jgi:hypothetical protein
MKIIFKSLVLLVLLSSILSCQKEKTVNPSLQQMDSDKKIENKEVTSLDNNNGDLEDFSNLVPLEIVDSTNSNVYEKFGIDLAGNCYDCDLAKIKINKKTFAFVNVCDTTDFYRIGNFTSSSTKTELKITTNANKFVFTKIDDLTVYKLEISGTILSLKNKRISKYYTNEKNLKKFKQHDCGDFQG